MQTHSLLTSIYESVFRFCVFPAPSPAFPEAPYLEKGLPWEKIPVHKDAQGMLRSQKKNHRFIFDPPTGSFRVSIGGREAVTGVIESQSMKSAGVLIQLQPADVIYGFGAASEGFNRNNRSFRLLNLDTLFYSVPGSSYSTFPFFLIRRQNTFTGIFFNNIRPARAQISTYERNPGGPGVKIDLDDHGDINFDFFIFDGTLPEILLRYSEITGKPFLPPLWSLGYHQSRWSYKTQQRVLDLGRRFRDENVPCDAIHLDIHYMDRYRVFTFSPERFPDPAAMNAELKEMGIRTVAIMDPGVLAKPGFPVYDSGAAGDYFCKTSNGSVYTGKVWPGKTVFPDFMKEDVRKWWAANHETLFKSGVSGIWNDMNDPVLRVNSRIDPSTEDIRQDGVTHAEVRNLYANQEAEATQQAFKKFVPEKRPFILTRSAFTGIQKHAALWTGDNFSSWPQLRENLNMVLNLGLSGVPFAGADVGGFGGSRGTFGILKLFRNPELFGRWMELGSLMPFFRAHTVLYSADQEPWSFGPEILDICRKHITRRYRLLPYIYSLFFDSSRTGAPIVRPLFYEFPDTKDKDSDDQFFLGPCLLAAPVLSPGISVRSVYLPPGDWYEFETGKKYSGPGRVEFNVRPGYYPLFVRGGSVLPVCKGGKNARESMDSDISLEVYPDSEIRGSLVLDDGDTRAAMDGIYTHYEFEGKRDRTGNIQLGISQLRKKFTPLQKNLFLRLPVQYRFMTFKNKKIEGNAIDLSREDRRITVQSFELPLTAAKLEFTYRISWP